MPPIKDLRYSQLVVIRVSHDSPSVTSNAAAVLREELARAVSKWAAEIPEHIRPTLEVLNVGNEDFPFREFHQC